MRPCVFWGLKGTWILPFVIILIFHSSAPLYALDPNKRINLYDMRVYTAKDGLPMTSLKKVFQDSKGYIWIGTQEGLVRFDGVAFKLFDKTTYPGLKSNFIWDIAEDSQGNLWLATKGGGISCFDGSSFKTIDVKDGLSDNNVNRLIVDEGDTVWIGTEKGLNRYNNGIIHTFSENDTLSKRNIQALVKDEYGAILASGYDDFLTVLFKGQIKHYNIISQALAMLKMGTDQVIFKNQVGQFYCFEKGSLSTKTPLEVFKKQFTNISLRSLIEDKDSNIWFASHELGLYRYNGFRLDSLNISNGLPAVDNSIISMMEDQEESVWLVGDAGMIQIKDNKFTTYNQFKDLKLPFATTVCESRDRKICIGFRKDGLFIFDPESFDQPRKIELPPFFEFTNVVPQNGGGLWLGIGYEGLYSYDEKRKLQAVRSGEHQKKNVGISSLFEDSRHALWIGQNGILSCFHDNEFIDHVFSDVGMPGIVTTIAEMREGEIWFGTWGLGLYRLINGVVTKEGITEILKSDGITTLYKDPEGLLWIGSENHGIFRYQNGVYDNFDGRAGLLSDKVFAILQDDSSRLWFSTNKGIFYANKHAFDEYLGGRLDLIPCQVFNHLDGMVDAEGTGRRVPVAWKSQDGKLWFTTVAGVVSVDPNNMPRNTVKPPVYVEEIITGDTMHRAAAAPLQLMAKERNLEIRYTALSYVVPERVLFKYKLEGYDKDWVDAQTRRKAFYTNLRPGQYIFRVIACNNDGVWNEDGAAQALIIPPFLWETWWAEIGYGVLFFAFIGWIARAYYKNKEFKAEALRREEHAARLAELDQAKSQFFANISHEFRTPLTVIRTPLDDLIAGTYQGNRFDLFRSMKRQADRLLTLINQLLDLSRLEASQIALQTTAHDLVLFCRTLIVSLQSLAQNRGIVLTFSAADPHLYAFIDHDKVEKILVNLVSNAVKFTPIGGSVDVTLRTLTVDEMANDPPADDGQNRLWIEIAVRDTGIGISAELQPHIFERFFRGNDPYVREYQGAGIGLSLAKEMAVLHGGDITVESVEGEGSCFRLRLPLETATAAQAASVTEPTDTESLIPKSVAPHQAVGDEEPAAQTSEDNAAPVILVVEDEADMRQLIRTQLKRTCTVLEAADGAEGFDQAVKEIPDLIICDVMMPKMDGMQLCRLLKHDDRTSHIPVILLTALARQEHKLQGLETGADDYLIKPFETAELSVRIRNLIENRRKLYQRLTIPAPLRSAHTNVSKDQFIAKLATIVTDHLSEEDFGVNDLAGAIGWSRRQLYRKLKAVVDQTPERFIYIIKLEFARQQLQTTSHSISEIAFQAGFSSPAHFSKLFREYYKVTPRGYRETVWKGSDWGKSEGDDE